MVLSPSGHWQRNLASIGVAKGIKFIFITIGTIGPEITDANTSGVQLTQGLTACGPSPTIQYQDVFIIFTSSSCQTNASSIRRCLSLP